MILMIDNYDSFTFNIVQYLGELGCQPRVVRNRDMDVEALSKLPVERLIISPGPCSPKEAGVSCDAIRHFSSKGIPVFGVCLGLQGIVEAFGGDTSFVTVTVVTMVGGTLASAAPTPGGVGAVEAALIGGLAAFGVPTAIAVPSVLLYRVLTVWLPVFAGWPIMRWLTKKDMI